jgi:hypothetical protein
VAENLPPERDESFVSDVTRLAPVVLISASVPGQVDSKGTGHVNERWQSYWAELFASHDYEVVDLVRPAMWENSKVECLERELEAERSKGPLRRILGR